MMALTMAFVGDTVPKEKAGGAMGLLGTMSAVGTALGLAGAAVLTRLMSALLFGVSPLDPITFCAVPAALAAITLLASYLPAARAAGMDPIEALRWE